MNEIGFYFYRLALNFKNKKVLQASFILQVIGMMISNCSFFVIWMFFNKAVGPINGWGPMQTFGMLSVSMFTFGVVHCMFGSVGKLADIVPNGAFDAYLTKPKNLYVRILNNEFTVSALGDLLQGFIGIIIFFFMIKISLENVFLFSLLIIPALLVEVSVIMLYDCIIFWLPQAPSLSQALFNFIILPTTQPISLLRGLMRYTYMFIIPALLIAGLPVEAITKHRWEFCLLSYTVATAWFLISYFVLKISIHRYESGNSIG